MIPRTIHQIWIGDINNIPFDEKDYIKSCKSVYNNFDYKFWTVDKIKKLNYFDDSSLKYIFEHIRDKKVYNCELKDTQYNVLLNDILRFKLLHLFGGIYFDNDIKHLRRIEFTILNNYDVIFSGDIINKNLYIGFMGSQKNSKFMYDCYKLVFRNIDKFNEGLFNRIDAADITGDNLNTVYFSGNYDEKIKVIDMKYIYSNRKCGNNEYMLHFGHQSWSK